jgi:hypothetical protein
MTENLITAVLVVAFLAVIVVVEMRKASKAEKTRIQLAELAIAEGKAKEAKEAKAVPLTSQAETIQPIVNHSLPMEQELADYMQDLPQIVNNIADVKRLAGKLKNQHKLGLWQTSMGRVIDIIQPNELIYAMTWNAHCVSMNREDKIKNYQESHGIVFFSARRFLYFKDPANIIEFPLEDIYTVDAHKGHYFDGISFRTHALDIQLSFASKICTKLFRDMIIYIAANAAVSPPSIDGAEAATPQICECPGCGATVIIHAYIKNKCEYCDRFVEKQQEIKSLKPISVADELKKYKNLADAGVISAEEFEQIKTKLLERV